MLNVDLKTYHLIKWQGYGGCGTRSEYQHFTKAQLWLQLVREDKVSP